MLSYAAQEAARRRAPPFQDSAVTFQVQLSQLIVVTSASLHLAR